MMRKTDAADIAVGYAAGPVGNGVVYASLVGRGNRETFRLAFRIAPACGEDFARIAGYAALALTVRAVRKRGIARAHFIMADRRLLEDIVTRRVPPGALELPYVRLRCALNALEDFTIREGATDELTQRAKAEAALNLAA